MIHFLFCFTNGIKSVQAKRSSDDHLSPNTSHHHNENNEIKKKHLYTKKNHECVIFLPLPDARTLNSIIVLVVPHSFW